MSKQMREKNVMRDILENGLQEKREEKTTSIKRMFPSIQRL